MKEVYYIAVNIVSIIPQRKNGKSWKDTEISSMKRNVLLDKVKHLGRTI